MSGADAKTTPHFTALQWRVSSVTDGLGTWLETQRMGGKWSNSDDSENTAMTRNDTQLSVADVRKFQGVWALDREKRVSKVAGALYTIGDRRPKLNVFDRKEDNMENGPSRPRNIILRALHDSMEPKEVRKSKQRTRNGFSPEFYPDFLVAWICSSLSLGFPRKLQNASACVHRENEKLRENGGQSQAIRKDVDGNRASSSVYEERDLVDGGQKNNVWKSQHSRRVVMMCIHT
ncbi:hypothetical protein C8R45DRAFT_944736 [Mycena sanguinolenta]|nr:hypothetical protein C8R45DRAFT_944736 [Mycena sanguinolenta]